MSDILIGKEIRHRLKAALEGMEINIDAEATAVELLQRLPAGWVLKDERLPAVYVFKSGENVSRTGLEIEGQEVFLDVALLARSIGDLEDQLDDLQLAVRKRVIAAGKFGLAEDVQFLSAEIPQDKGAVILGARLLKYSVRLSVTANDPSL